MHEPSDSLIDMRHFRSRIIFGSKHIVGIAVCLTSIWNSVFANSLIGQYKTGIDLTLSGVEGVDWVVEHHYHDPKIYPKKVVYIRSTTKIGFKHNDRNIASGVADAGDQGVIRYRIDGDMNVSRSWLAETPFTAPFSFAELTYAAYGDGNVKVLGTIGPKPGEVLSGKNRQNYYWRGHLDSVGDEWHTLSVADDDSAFAKAGTQEENLASDGVVVAFIVDPKTPWMKVSSTGDAQFYTTPAKNYHIPKIHDQITYILPRNGSVHFSLGALNGQKVFYRIVRSLDDESTPYASKAETVLQIKDTDFPEGRSFLQYYCKGQESSKKVREIVKNPSFPSKSEPHGDRFWGGAQNWQRIRNKIESNPSTLWWIKEWKTSSRYNNLEALDGFGDGRRRKVSTSVARDSINALLARYEGVEAKRAKKEKSFADYALKGLLDTATTIDPVGFEKRHTGGAIPSAELAHRGYYDANDIYDAAFTYDIIAGYYRADQCERGMTQIEDLLIRDLLATYVLMSNLEIGGWCGLGDSFDNGGMWDTARRTGAYMVMCVMPSYSTHYLGTSGLNGEKATHKWVPFPDRAYSWRELFVENNAPLEGFPNLSRRFGIEEYLLDENGDFTQSSGYTDTMMLGHCFVNFANMWKLFAPSQRMPRLEKFFKKASKKELNSLLDNKKSIFLANAGILNSFFPDLIDDAKTIMNARGSSDGQSLSKQLQRGGPLYIIWYEHDLKEEDVAGLRIMGSPRNLRIKNGEN